MLGVDEKLRLALGVVPVRETRLDLADECDLGSLLVFIRRVQVEDLDDLRKEYKKYTFNGGTSNNT